MFRSCLSFIPMGCCFRGAVINVNTDSEPPFLITSAQIGTYGEVAHPLEDKANLQKKISFVLPQPIFNDDNSKNLIEIESISPHLIIPQHSENNGDGVVRNDDNSKNLIEIESISPHLIIPQHSENNGDGVVSIDNFRDPIVISSSPSNTIGDFLIDKKLATSLPRVLNVRQFKGDTTGKVWVRQVC